jgi:hypothetical protein
MTKSKNSSKAKIQFLFTYFAAKLWLQSNFRYYKKYSTLFLWRYKHTIIILNLNWTASARSQNYEQNYIPKFKYHLYYIIVLFAERKNLSLSVLKTYYLLIYTCIEELITKNLLLSVLFWNFSLDRRRQKNESFYTFILISFKVQMYGQTSIHAIHGQLSLRRYRVQKVGKKCHIRRKNSENIWECVKFHLAWWTPRVST